MSVNVNRLVEDLPQHPTLRYGLRMWDAAANDWQESKDADAAAVRDSLEQIKLITVHHTAAPADQQLSVIANFHINTRGWPGISYHLVVLPDGTIVQTQDLHLRTYHDRHNTHSVGICVKGNFEEDQPNKLQVGGLRAAIKWTEGMLGGHNLAVVMHKDRGSSAECPGQHLVRRIQDKKPASTKGPFAKWQERQITATEAKADSMEIAVAWANEKGNGYEHYFRQIIAKYLQTHDAADVMDLLDGLVKSDKSIEDVVQRLVITGSRENMVKNYGDGWE